MASSVTDATQTPSTGSQPETTGSGKFKKKPKPIDTQSDPVEVIWHQTVNKQTGSQIRRDQPGNTPYPKDKVIFKKKEPKTGE